MAVILDFDKFEDELFDVCVRTIRRVKSDLDVNKGEIGAFCLYTNEGAMVVDAIFAPKDYVQNYKGETFNWDEWPIDDYSEPEFNKACSKIADYVLGSGDSVETIRAQLLATMVATAERVRNEVLNDPEVMILVALDGGGEDAGFEKRLEKLNTPDVVALYKEWQRAQQEVESLDDPFKS